jgi:threonine dehydratase
VEHPVTTQIADGMACRTPEADALEMIWRHVARVVQVSDAEVASAMRLMFTAIHNVAEGAGAAALAAALKERTRVAGRKIALVLSGANVDHDVLRVY